MPLRFRRRSAFKDFAVTMEVKNKGVEFEVYDNAGKFLGATWS
jgi:hypothetical protein